MAEFLTTKDVAALLRIKERKVYELVRDKAIPASRVTGKLLFPRDMVEAWVRRNVEFRDGTEGLVARPAVVAGSHDPLLDWALRESGSGLATYFDGSLSGLRGAPSPPGCMSTSHRPRTGTAAISASGFRASPSS
jgi:excisionase family DNA binding protein